MDGSSASAETMPNAGGSSELSSRTSFNPAKGGVSPAYSAGQVLRQGLEYGENRRYSLGVSGGYAQRFGASKFGAFATAGVDAGETPSRSLLGDSETSVTASAGVRATFEQDTTWGSVTPELRFSYIREISGGERGNVLGSSSAQRSTYSRSDFSLLPEGAEERWMLGIGTALDTEDGLRLYMDYQSGIRLGVPRFDGVVRAGVRADF